MIDKPIRLILIRYYQAMIKLVPASLKPNATKKLIATNIAFIIKNWSFLIVLALTNPSAPGFFTPYLTPLHTNNTMNFEKTLDTSPNTSRVRRVKHTTWHRLANSSGLRITQRQPIDASNR